MRKTAKISRITAKQCMKEQERHSVERHSGIPDFIAPEGDVTMRESSKEAFRRESTEKKHELRRQRAFLARKRAVS